MGLTIVIIACVINFILGLFVLLRDSRSVAFRAFMTMTTLICIWIISSYVTSTASFGLQTNDAANRIAFAAGYGIVLSGLWFTYNFPVKRIVSRLEIRLLFVLSIFIILFSLTTLVAGQVSLHSGVLQFTNGNLIFVYIIAFLGMVALIIRNLINLPNRVQRKIKTQAHLVLIAFVLSATFGLITNVVIPAISTDWQTTEVGPFTTVLLVLVIVYAVIRHGLFDVRLAVVRTAAYVLSISTLAGLYFALAYTVSTVFLSHDSLIQPVSVVLALVLAFIFQPVKHFFDRVTNSLFYKDNYSIDDFLSRLNHILNSTTDVRNLLQHAAVEISRTLKAEQAIFYVFINDERYISTGTPNHRQLSLKDMRSIADFGPNIIINSQLDTVSPLSTMLTSHRMELIMPLYNNEGLLGYLCLGEHLTSGYTSRDMRALETVSDELVIAIQNALSIEEVRRLNDTLQQRINEATRELRASNAQLQRLDEAKDEFISMASHQLRTPLTSVKGYISMVVEGDAGSVNEQQKHLLGEAFLSSERMVRLIGEFLNVSRLQTGKFMIEKHPTDLVQVIKQEIEGLMPSAKAHGLALGFVPPKKFPIVNIDENKIRQVIMNFSDNAIYYSKEKTRINLSLKIEGPDIIFTVKDTGIGVPIAEQSSLFNKFFRATNARQQRPDGTGVGLFLAKKVIDAHHGEIIFESIEGKGSTFGFRLPLAAAKVDEATVTLPVELVQQ